MPDPNPRSVCALAIDVDGTLLDPGHEVTSAAQQAVHMLRDSGVLPVITTSRPPAAIAAFVRLLDLADMPVVTCQGAVWGSTDSVGTFHARTEHPVNIDDARDVARLAHEHGFGVSWFYPDCWLAESADPLVAQEEVITGTSARRVSQLTDEVRPPLKILIMATPGREAELSGMSRALPSTVAGATSRSDYLEIVKRGVSKWSALEEVFAAHDVPIDRTAAIGDGNNDLEMISNAAIGIAMGHAPSTVRQAARWIAPDNRHEGFAAAVAWLLRHGLDAD
ncbi:5-amino-6-(5-phospho-D-ribitylamino)uracil phosphatase YitU [Propionicimonas sp. T2.31MG-18]|uniref:HAD-IIB family hydrolase n=1 Tax=Propionicimonas sp. T2.31MG-18 TaxID=3157620 RepID=UPI0035E8B195